MLLKARIFLILTIFLVCVGETQAQRWKRMRKEVMWGFTTTNFLGELGGKNAIGTNDIKDFDTQSTKPGFTMGYYYRLSNRSAYQIRSTFGFLGGNDALTQEPFRNNRNLHFRSPIIDLSAQLDIYLLMKRRAGHKYSIRGVRGRSLTDYYIYGFLGVGAFWFDPYAKDTRIDGDGKWHRLKPLHTEGQSLIPTRKNYSNFQPCIPIGIGGRFAINRMWMIGIEYGFRHTWTDYIDDVSKTYIDPQAIMDANGDKGALAVYLANPSATKDVLVSPTPEGFNYSITAAGQQRGDPRDRDSYMFASITVFYKLPRRGFAIPKF